MRFLLTLASCLPLLLAGQAARAAETPPNVLLIMMDDLRPELDCYGNLATRPEHQPLIEALSLHLAASRN